MKSAPSLPNIAEPAPAGAAPVGDVHPDRWRMLGLLTVAELLGMTLWFAASAVSAQFTAQWTLSSSDAAWLTTIVQLGFVAGTAISAVLNLADIVPARLLFACCALVGAAANAMLLGADGLSAALAWRFITGLALAGVYPPAMKMIATWFRARRGLAVGTIVGALTVGKAMPYLVHAIPGAGITPVVASASVGAGMAALLVWFGYREGPYPFPARKFSRYLVRDVLRTPAWRLSTGGYLGHMFELYAAWTWLPVFIAASIAAHDPAAGARGASVASAIAFAALAIGGAGCIWGRTRGRSPRTRVAGDAGDGHQRHLLGPDRLRVRTLAVAAGADRAGVGLLRDRRQRPIFGTGHRECAAACRGHRSHAANLARLFAHGRGDSTRATARGARGMAVGVRGALAGADLRDREHRAVGTQSGGPPLGTRGSRNDPPPVHRRRHEPA